MSITVEKATISEVDSLIKLLSLLFTQEQEFEPNADAHKKALDILIHDPAAGDIFVLKKDFQIIGMATLLYSISTALGEKVAILEDVVILPDNRNQGLGSKFISKIIEYAKAEGCYRITLLTDSNNLSAQSFYQKLGFNKTQMIPMRLKIKN